MKVKKSLEQQIRRMLWWIFVPLVLMLVMSMGVLAVCSISYNKLSHNLALGSQFSLNFKEEIDLKMYYYTVESRFQKELPLEELQEAQKLAAALEKSTDRKESKKALNNLRDYMRSLKKKMILLSEERSYDARMEQLDNNIRILTGLIQTEMQRYIYYEAGYLVEVEQQLVESIRATIVLLVLFMMVVVLLAMRKAMELSAHISQPIQEICANIKKVGEGQFDIQPVQAYDREVEILDRGICRMARKIDDLLSEEKKEQEEKRLKELQLLQAQVSPHFLYNTLDTIVWQIEDGDSDGAIRLISKLSTFFRTSLSKGNDIITLEEELLHTKSYLEIQQIRYGNIMDFEMEVPDSLMEIRLPKLTIQPLVENALYHGIKLTRKHGLIRVQIFDREDKIEIRVSDNGQGMTKERKEEILYSMEHHTQSGRAGFGLITVHQRLRLYYGDCYRIAIDTEEGAGTAICLSICKDIEL